MDMGIEPFMISSSLLGVVSQRLVRKICADCKEEYEIPKESEEIIASLKDIDEKQTRAYRGRGCAACMNSGYKGRIAIFEYLSINDDIKHAILAKASADEIRQIAVKAGMKLLKQDGLKKALQGETTIEEVLRVTQDE
jgi:type II secretory ATPase GspE/PulE/Tfp pilus assembly ATPase PilB-like protein